MFDIAVIGGGLAGCHAAITLAQRHHSVLLLEAGSYPRPKVCGEFLSPECAALFEETGFLPSLEALNPASINTVRMTAPNGVEWHADLPGKAIGISRYALDAALIRYADHVGVTVHDRAKVTGIDGNLPEGFVLTVRTLDGIRRFQAKAVIAAYGKHSGLDRTLHRSFLNRHQRYVALKRHFTGPPLPQRIDLHVFRGGYCGMSHVESNVTNVCLLVQQQVFRETLHDKPDDVEPFIEWMCQQNGCLGEWLRQASPLDDKWLSIAQIPLVTKTPIEGDILFTGDAAGMVAPLAGDGMAMALHSGKMAAQCLDAYLTQQLSATAMKQRYAHTWNRTFRRRLQLGRLLQSVMLRPRLLGAGLRAINLLPAIGDFLVTQTRDLSLLEQE